MTDGSVRRAEIAALLEKADSPLSAAHLASQLGVSRQVIVQDIALLRTGGQTIFATPEGYLLPALEPAAAARRVVAARHRDNAGMRRELETVVRLGGTVVDVSIEHPVYGEISAPLHLRTQAGVDRFMANFETGGTSPISLLTDGVHLHTVEAPSQGAMERILSALREAGILVE